jgi:hypothetical protein
LQARLHQGNWVSKLLCARAVLNLDTLGLGLVELGVIALL